MSTKTVFWAAPCLIGVTGLMALFSSMSGTGTVQQEVSSVPQQNTQVTNADSAPVSVLEPPKIDAKPLPSQNAIAAEPLQLTPKKSATTDLKKAVKAQSPISPANKPQPKVAVKPSAPVQAKPAPKPQQSALKMQAFSPANAPDVPDIPIRVAIARKVASVNLAISEAGIVTDSSGQVLASLSAQQSTSAFYSSGVQLGGLKSTQPLWIRAKSENGLVFVDGRWYRGIVQIVPHDGVLTVVNHVEMQPYLYSVVGAEMFHDWPLEALKAQAIAARSYALVHIVRPASRLYDLGSTQRWQAYKGVNSEASPPRNAVNDTKGIVISHNGGVVESLYASSAELVQDAHKGFGMSQYGARDLAKQNLDYRQILSRFYPGTELSLLQNK